MSVPMAVGGSSFAGARYWRLLRLSGGSSYWEYRADNTSDNGVFESGDLSGTDIAAALLGPYQANPTVMHRNADGTKNSYGGGYDRNIFGQTGYMTSYGTYPTDLWFDFGSGSQYIIGSIRTFANTASYQAGSMKLQWSDDNSTWNDWATLNATGGVRNYYRNIVEGATIAATAS